MAVLNISKTIRHRTSKMLQNFFYKWENLCVKLWVTWVVIVDQDGTKVDRWQSQGLRLCLNLRIYSSSIVVREAGLVTKQEVDFFNFFTWRLKYSNYVPKFKNLITYDFQKSGLLWPIWPAGLATFLKIMKYVDAEFEIWFAMLSYL